MLAARDCETGEIAPPRWSALSETHWLDARRITVYSRVFVAIYAVSIVVMLALSPHFIDPTGKPVGTDFLCFWSAGKMVLEGRSADAYDFYQQRTMEQKVMPGKEGQPLPLYPWLYPPMFLAVAGALALMPYGAALGVWMAATLSAYLASISEILPGRTARLAALAFPAVLVNLSHGQNGFVTAGLLGSAVLLLERRPWVAGVLFGLLAYKPQFALLIPVALVVGRCWRTITAAAATVAATSGASLVIFGAGTWRAFFTWMKVTRTYLLEQGAPGWEKIQSIFSAVRMFGGSIPMAYAAQAVFAGVAAVAVVWVWWRRPDSGALKGAVLATATLMATPYVLDYDLIVLALPIAWLAAIGLHEGFLPWEKITLAAVWLLPLLSRMMGGFLRLPLAPAVMALLLAVIVRRAALASDAEAG